MPTIRAKSEIIETAKAKKRGKPKARGNGSGTIYALSDKRYRWQFRNADGRVLASGICKKKNEAADKLAEARTNSNRGTLASADRVTVAEYASAWLLSQKQLRERTRTLYQVELNFALEYLGSFKMRDVRPVHIKHALSKLSERIMKKGLGKDKPMSGSTLAKIRARVRSMFAEAVRDQIIYINPGDAVRRIKTAETLEENLGVALDFEQAARFHEIGEALYAAGCCRLWVGLFVAVSVGLRRGEVMGLRWSDIDFDEKILRVRQNYTTNDGKAMMSATKTRRSKRDIPMPPSLWAALKAHRETLKAESKVRGEAFRSDSPVCATDLGTYTHPDNLERALRSVLEWSSPAPIERRVKLKKGEPKISQKTKIITFEQRLKRSIPVQHRPSFEGLIMAGNPLPKLSPHDLRHTAATLMLRRGVPVEVVSKILGHANISITYNIYRHVLDSETRAVMVDLFPQPVPIREIVSAPVN
jgi:integrase